MSEKKITALETRIARVKEELQDIGPMRPGSLNLQYKDRVTQTGAYWQLNYTHRMKTHTEYVRPIFLDRIGAEIAEYKHFRELVETWVELSIQLSKIKIEVAKKQRENS